MARGYAIVDKIPSVLRARSGMLMAAASRLGPLLVFVLWTMVTVVLPGSDEGGWQPSRLGTAAAVTEEEHCTVERRAHLTYPEFMQHYAFLKPVILQGLTDNSKFRALCSRENLLASFGDNVVRLSTANTYSYQKVDLPFQEYVEQLLHPQDPTSLGNGAGSGVPFHWHGPGFSEVIYGRKRWFLYPPEKTPEFHPNKTTLAWLQEIYPSLAPSARPLECTIQAGEALYFPDRWWHATLNLDTSVFISTFLG
ncbi:jmjC domain-containing protein 8 isoform X3 [Cricetulus griseus]|uniref:JmjC domain-containing protein 8 isoform X3 n=1 Tax=Cricetulus griseus TaxID=10029 RepID=A0A9J7GAL1_CRIGR|nr:jmjC domain-containing protein 8 isoform X3 [Cricetulus griseus]XP_027291764.1 jmjC domain-containing protein 8 isoform X3 [Cricetulus griseus]